MATLIPEMSEGSFYDDRVIEISGASVLAQLGSVFIDTHGSRFTSVYVEWAYASGGPGAASTLTFKASNRNSSMTLPWEPSATFGDCSVAGNTVTLDNQLVGAAYIVFEGSPRFISCVDSYSFTGSGDATGTVYGTK